MITNENLEDMGDSILTLFTLMEQRDRKKVFEKVFERFCHLCYKDLRIDGKLIKCYCNPIYDEQGI